MSRSCIATRVPGLLAYLSLTPGICHANGAVTLILVLLDGAEEGSGVECGWGEARVRVRQGVSWDAVFAEVR